MRITSIVIASLLYPCTRSQIPIIIVGTNQATSIDLIGFAGGSCNMMYTNFPASRACDFDLTTYFQGALPYPAVANEFDRAFYVQWSSPQQIRSFYGDVRSLGATVDVYVSYGLIQRGDSRYVCQAAILPNGVFNCPYSMVGTHLVFWPLSTEEPGNLTFAELRAWSRPDLANSATVTCGGSCLYQNGGSLSEIFGPSPTIDFEVESTTPGYIYFDLGAVYKIKDVWIRGGINSVLSNHRFQVNFGTTYSATPYAVTCGYDSANNDYEEYIYTIAPPTDGQYFITGKTQCNGCCLPSSEHIFFRKIAVFGEDLCTTSTPTVSLLTVYPTFEYVGSPLSIAWPSYTMTELDAFGQPCFGLIDLGFQDQNNNDLVLDGTVVIDWVLKTITYQRLVKVYDPFITIYASFSTPVAFTNAGTVIPFDVSCASAVINQQTFAPAWAYQIIQPLPNLQSVLQFSMHSDSVGQANNNPGKCGIKHYISNAPWVTIRVPADPLTGNFELLVNTNDYTLAGIQTVTFTVYLNVASPTFATFDVPLQLIHPCKLTSITTVQTIPTIIYPFGSPAVVTTFIDFSDSVATQYAVPTLCGLVYSIIDPTNAATYGVTNTGLQISVATNNSSLIGTSIGLFLIANATPLQDIASQQVPFTVTIQDTCPSAVVQLSFSALTAMTYKFGDPATSQTFPLDATTDKSVVTSTPNLCGPIAYQILEGYTFAAVAYATAPGTITIQTNSLSDIAQYTATFDAYLVNYPTAVHAQITFAIDVVDACLTSALSMPSTLANVTIYVNSGLGNSQTFLPAANDVETNLSLPGLCGPRLYSIVQVQPQNFITITAPVSGDPLTDPWRIDFVSSSALDAGLWLVSLKATLQNYPLVPPAIKMLQAKVIVPCINTVLLPEVILAMKFTVGFEQTITQQFLQFKDTDAEILKMPNLCQGRTYEIVEGYPFISISVPADPWKDVYSINLFTSDPGVAGKYTVNLKCSLANYPLNPPANVAFQVEIFNSPNKLPYFSPKLASSATILMTAGSQPWSFNLPKIIDENDPVETVKLTANFGFAANFVTLEGATAIAIADISMSGTSNIREGMFLITFTLDDTKGQVSYSFALFVVKPAITEPVAQTEQAANYAPVKAEMTGEVSLENAEQDDKSVSEQNENSFDWEAAFSEQQRLADLKKKEALEKDPRWTPIPPTPFFEDITSKGQVLIGFSSEVFIVPNLTMINNGTIYLSDLERKRDLQSRFFRELDVSTKANDPRKGQEIPVLSVEVIPGLESNSSQLSFRWNVTYETEAVLSIQLYFDEPLYVSFNPIPDKLRVTFNDPSLFMSTAGLYMAEHEQIIEKVLPQQLRIHGSDQAVAAALENAGSSAKSVVFINFIVNILLTASLQSLWNMINAQQLIVLLPLFDVTMPANAQLFFNQIMKIAAFDIVDTEHLLNSMLHLNTTGPLNQNFGRLGFDSLWFLNNMGSLIFGFVGYGIAMLLLKCLEKQNDNSSLKVETYYEKLRHLLFYNLIVSILTESYAIISVCCMINLTNVSFKSFGAAFQTSIMLVFFVLLFVYPVLITLYTYRNWHRIDELKESIHGFLQELRTKTGPVILVYSNYFLFRRLLMALCVVFLRSKLFAQIMVKAFSTVAAVIIIGQIECFETRFKRNMEFANEMMIMLILYNVICFSQFVPDPQAKFKMGYFCCFIVALQLTVNLYIILRNNVKNIVFRFKMYKAKKTLAGERKRNVVFNHFRKRRVPREIPQTIIVDLSQDEESESEESDSGEDELNDHHAQHLLKRPLLGGDLEDIEEDSKEELDNSSHGQRNPQFSNARNELLLIEDGMNRDSCDLIDHDIQDLLKDFGVNVVMEKVEKASNDFHIDQHVNPGKSKLDSINAKIKSRFQSGVTSVHQDGGEEVEAYTRSKGLRLKTQISDYDDPLEEEKRVDSQQFKTVFAETAFDQPMDQYHFVHTRKPSDIITQDIRQGQIQPEKKIDISGYTTLQREQIKRLIPGAVEFIEE